MMFNCSSPRWCWSPRGEKVEPSDCFPPLAVHAVHRHRHLIKIKTRDILNIYWYIEQSRRFWGDAHKVFFLKTRIPPLIFWSSQYIVIAQLFFISPDTLTDRPVAENTKNVVQISVIWKRSQKNLLISKESLTLCVTLETVTRCQTLSLKDSPGGFTFAQIGMDVNVIFILSAASGTLSKKKRYYLGIFPKRRPPPPFGNPLSKNFF